jgi:hypothetical protein
MGKILYTYRVLNRCGDRDQLNWLVRRVLRIGVGGCSTLGGGHHPWAGFGVLSLAVLRWC